MPFSITSTNVASLAIYYISSISSSYTQFNHSLIRFSTHKPVKRKTTHFHRVSRDPILGHQGHTQEHPLQTSSATMSTPQAPTSAKRSTFFPSYTNNIQQFLAAQQQAATANRTTPRVYTDDELILAQALMDTHDQAIRDHQRTEEEESQQRAAAATLLDFSQNPVRFPLQDPHPLTAQDEDAEMTDAGDSGWATTEDDSGSVASAAGAQAADADAEMSDSQATEILKGGFRRRENRSGEGQNRDREDSDSDLTDILDELTPPTSPANVGGQTVIPAPRRAQRQAPPRRAAQGEAGYDKHWYTKAIAEDAANMSDDDEPRQLEQIEWMTLMALGPQETRERMRRQLRGEQGDEVEEQERVYALEEPIVIPSDDEDEEYGAGRKRKTRSSKEKGKGKGKWKKVIPDEA